MSGPTKIPSFNFASDRPGNFLHRYLKHSPSFGKALQTASSVQALYEEVVGVLFWDQLDYPGPHFYHLVLKQLYWAIVFGSSVGS
jgi:hypothetical protein